MPNVSSVASRVWMTTGSARSSASRDLGPKDRLLHVARREIVVVVEADLADGPRALVSNALPHERTRVVEPAGKLPRLVGVDADREADLRPQGPDPRRGG